MTPKVFVIDKEGKPCLPTHPARARKLLRSGKARVIRVVPFTIQLERIIENPVGSFTIGICLCVVLIQYGFESHYLSGLVQRTRHR